VAEVFSAPIQKQGQISVTDRKQMNEFLKETGQCGTGALVSFAAECNNYTRGIVQVVANAGSSTAQVSFQLMGTGWGSGGYIQTGALASNFAINNGAGFDLRSDGNQGFAQIPSTLVLYSENSKLSPSTSIVVILAYRARNQSQPREFGRATL
jgi:hypothetical protein